LRLTGYTPWEIWRERQETWLQDNGYTPESTGLSWNRLRTAAPWLRWIQENTHEGGWLKPEVIREAMDIANTTQAYDANYVMDMIRSRYVNTREYVEKGNKDPGRYTWFMDRDDVLPDVWWYYHP